ncbi:MAG: glycosyltransferase family A protein [Planctomycetia bacterium]|nr:glycosyltransferase family A protein [Planctomycetia bacterium]
MDTTVTLIVPVYNASEFLPKCLDSIRNQTLTEIQVLCVNDGSTDGSLELLRRYASWDARFTVLDKPNEGAGPTRNYAYPHITGRYVFFCDPDDWLERDMLETMVSFMEKEQADVLFFPWFVDETPVVLPEAGENPSRRWFLRETSCGSWGRLYQREFLLERHLFFSRHRRGQDQIVFWRACLEAEHPCFFPEPKYHYRKNLDVATVQKIKTRGIDIVDVHVGIRKYLEESGQFQEYKDIYYFRKLCELCVLSRSADRSIYREFLRRIQSTLTPEEWTLLENDQAGIPLDITDFYLSLHPWKYAWKRLKIFYWFLRWNRGGR